MNTIDICFTLRSLLFSASSGEVVNSKIVDEVQTLVDDRKTLAALRVLVQDFHLVDEAGLANIIADATELLWQ